MKPGDIIGGYLKEYNKEYNTEGIQLVTTVMDKSDDNCDEAIMRRVRVTDKETMIRDGYNEHNRRTYQTYITTIPPRKFYNETSVWAFVSYINKTAGRTLEDDEMNVLLKTITKGRQYELVCVIDRTEELKDVTKWA